MTDEGGAEIDAEVALAQLTAAIDEVLEKAGARRARGITHAVASCFWHSLVGVDREGNALTPVYGWADTRSAKYAKVLRQNFDATAPARGFTRRIGLQNCCGCARKNRKSFKKLING